MNARSAVFLVALALVYHALAIPLYRLGGAVPDFLLIVVVYLAFFAPIGELLILAVGASVVVDVLSLDPIGSHMAALVPVILVIGRVRGWFVLRGPGLRSVFVFVAALLASLGRTTYVALVSVDGAQVSVEALSAVYTTLIAVLVHGLLDRYRRRLGWVRDRAFGGRR